MIILSAFLLMVNVSLGLLLTFQSSSSMTSQIRARMSDVVNSAANKRFGGLWEVTAGGSALRGEAPEDCAKRELREETGIAADELEWKARTVNPQNHTIYYEYYCKTDCDKRAVTLQEGETSAYRWVDRNTLREMKAQGALTERSKQLVSAALRTE